ncbi:TPA: hypothetical protein LAG04_001597 [Escherichia coli]|nr:hypothetical protein [Shigella sonnei]HBI9868516.1 hypothetical protein [Escherichia coli]
MKNVKIWFYDNTKIGADGYISFTKSIDDKLGAKQVAAITDKFNNAADNKDMFKVLSAKLRKVKKYEFTEKQIENLLAPAKKFFKVDHLVITHLEVIDVKGKKFVAAVASRVKRDSLGDVAKVLDRRVFWFGCRFNVDKLTREVKITCSTSAGVKPYFSVLSEEKHHDNGTSFRSTTISRVESDAVINEYDRKKPVTEERKAQLKAAKETFKAKKAAKKEEARKAQEKADAEKKEKENAFAPIRDNAKKIDSQLDSFEMPQEDNKPTVELPKLTIRDVYAVNLPKVVIDDLVSKAESFNKKEEEMPMEEKKTHQIMIDGKLVTMVVKEEEYKPSFNIADLRAAFLASHKPMNWDDYEVANDNEEDYEEMSDEDREAMERDADLLHMEMYGCGYGCGVRSFRK